VADVEIDVSDAVRALERLSDALGDLRPAMSTIARQAAAQARLSAPRRTGRLSRSIDAEAGRARASVVAAAPYSRYVAYGTRRMRAHPFMRRADRVLTDVAQHEIERAVEDQVRRTGLG
jgi:HK97 gp10 family phage protein